MDDLKDRIRGYARKRNAQNRLKRAAVDTPHGFKFSGPTEMQNGTFEAPETALIRKIMAQSDLFINVGANVGYYCCFAQGAGLKTYAIEPVAINAALLMVNMRANGWGEDITILPLAVGETSGVVTIYGEGTGASLVEGWARNPVSLAQDVPAVRLDDVIPAVTDATFILMDVEGFELYALRGSARLLADKPTLLIEISITHHQPGGATLSTTAQDTFALLYDAGYSAYEVTDTLRALDWDEIAAACRGEDTPIVSHNFLFIEAGTAPPA
jgi:FkbM family methyltransferase